MERETGFEPDVQLGKSHDVPTQRRMKTAEATL
jgi:hypothetical protein